MSFVATRLSENEEEQTLLSQESRPSQLMTPSTPTRRRCRPLLVFILLTIINFLIYFDRGALSGSLSSVRDDARIRSSQSTLSGRQSGLLASIFMVGFMVACPCFASIGGLFPSRLIMAFGMTIWCGACAGTALAQSYRVLLVCRALVGIGEAAFVGFSLTIVDNIVPHGKRTLWIGWFYAMIPVGTALGVGLSGSLSSLEGPAWLTSWRTCFFGEFLLALPFVAALVYIPTSYERAVHQTDSSPPATTYATLGVAVRSLFCSAKYVFVVLGLAAYCFAIGGVSVWAIPMLSQGPLHFGAATAAIIVGSVSSLCGIVGTVVGGAVVDAFGGSSGTKGACTSLLFSILAMLLGVPAGLWALSTANHTVFFISFAAALFLFFSTTAPVNACILTVVAPHLRPYAVSFSVFLIHLLGDFPSPTIVGYLSDRFGLTCGACLSADCCVRTNEQYCLWQQKSTNHGVCVEEFQLTKALCLVFSVSFLSVPLWSAGLWCIRRERSPTEEVVDEPASNGNERPESVSN